MSVISCLTWVPRGYASPTPRQAELTPEQLGLSEEDFNGEPVFSSVSHEPVLEGVEDEDAVDMQILPTDALLLTGLQNGDFCELHVYVYIQADTNLFVHHDYMLPAYPLSLAWMPFNPNDPSRPANCVAVSSFEPTIEVWDLDVVDSLEPVKILGKKKGGHRDSVISLSLHPTRNNFLASGSADTSVKIWDVIEGTCKVTLAHHSDKVNSVAWHNTEEKVLASAAFDGSVIICAADAPKTCLKTTLPQGVESLQWHTHNPSLLLASTESGSVSLFDIRNLQTAVSTWQAHREQCCLTMSPGKEGLLATASFDKTVKLWDLRGDVRPLVEKDMKVDELFCAQFDREAPFVLATGGLGGQLAIWDTEENSAVAAAFN
jgi:periodic tryptophan protein 1